MASEQAPDAVLALVAQGWDHLRRQRPLAAWASWQRALRVAPGDRAAAEALDHLAHAENLPSAARAVYRFRSPADDARRRYWDATFAGRDLEQIDRAADVFRQIAQDDPADSAAVFNLALCEAWLGRNAEAVETLERFVALTAAADFDAAVDAWALSEILRQGAGAEALADDLSYSLSLAWNAAAGDPIEWLSGLAELAVPSGGPVAATDASGRPEVRVAEWLDRPMPAATADLTAHDLPRVRAVVLAAPGVIRFSSPNRRTFLEVDREICQALGGDPTGADRRSTPLSITIMDAAVGLLRLPEGLDEPTRLRLAREAVESFFETDWLILARYRHGLRTGSSFALEDSTDPVNRAKLEAVVRIREQLAARPRAAPVYGGYPFDRLRRRVGLEPHDPAAVDSGDVTCMSRQELATLDIVKLDIPRMLEAYRSTSSLIAALASPAGTPADLIATQARLAGALARHDPALVPRDESSLGPSPRPDNPESP